MIYHDMWLLYSDSILSFYDMKDGTLVNTLALRQYGSEQISLVSLAYKRVKNTALQMFLRIPFSKILVFTTRPNDRDSLHS
jgi:hypothetical protein